MNALQFTGRQQYRWWVILGMLALLSVGGIRADEWFVKFAGIKGELTDGKFDGWSRLTSVSSMVSLAVDPASGATGQPSFGCSITKVADRTSPVLLSRCGRSERIPRVTLAYLLSSPNVTQYRISLDNVLISSLSEGGSDSAAGGGGGIYDQIFFSFQKIEWTCFALDDNGGNTGGLTGTYDLATLKGDLKSHRPFKAVIDRQSERSGVLITCPVEAGHMYRILACPSIGKPWNTLLEFTANENGDSSQFVAMQTPSLLMRVEEID